MVRETKAALNGALLSSKLRHIWPIAIYGFFYMVWFDMIEEAEGRDYLVLGSEMDEAIPFVEAFVVPYLSWFIFMLFWGLLLFVKDTDAYDRMTTFLIIGMTFFLVVSTLVPTAVNLRPAVLPRRNIFTYLIGLLWKVDTPTNVWPSIHVFNTAAIYTSVVRSSIWKKMKTSLRTGLGLWSLSIILSTVFIKQHSLLDVIAGLIMMVVLSFFINDLDLVFRFKWWDALWDRRVNTESVRRKKKAYSRQ